MVSPFRIALATFAVGLTGLGVLGIACRDFALQWQPVAPWVPGRTALAYLAAALMLVCGPALLFPRTRRWASRLLFAYLFVWLLLKVPALVVAPRMEAVWLGAGEIAVLFAGGWCVCMELGGTTRRSLRAVSLLLGAALFPIGLSHLVYPMQTVQLVPPWLPFPGLLASLTGLAQMLCGLAILGGFRARLAATFEAALIALFTALVWAPDVIAAPTVRLNWTAFWISWTIGAAAWCAAATMPAGDSAGVDWIRGKRRLTVSESRDPAVVK